MNRSTEMDITWRFFSGKVEEKNAGSGTRIRSIIGGHKIDGGG